MLLLSSISGLGQLISYLFNARTVSKAYSFHYIVYYISLPALLFSISILVLSYWDRDKSKMKVVFIYLFSIHIFLFVLLFLFFKGESNKLKVVIKNLSNGRIEGIKFIARDIEVFYSKSLNRKDSLVFVCNCREAQDNIEKVGIDMEYKGNFGKVQYKLLPPNQPIYKNSLEVLLGDTISFMNSDIEYQWIRLDKQEPAYSTKD